jgi:diguanylate cyclase (GGDEF)-like protein
MPSVSTLTELQEASVLPASSQKNYRSPEQAITVHGKKFVFAKVEQREGRGVGLSEGSKKPWRGCLQERCNLGLGCNLRQSVSGKGMNDLVETWQTAPKRPRTTGACDALLVHIYPPGAVMGTRYVLKSRPLLIGRGPDCDIRLTESSVSRHHARISLDAEEFVVSDLQSTNGTFVNDNATERCALKDGDYLRVGNCIYRFLAGDNIEAAYHEEIYRRTIIDALTDIHNKRYLVEYLDRELARSTRYHRPLALVMFDVDQFKAINDQLGHLAGDFTLRELATRVKAGINKEEEFARYGGDEFVIVLPETNHDRAVDFADGIRQLVAQRPFQYESKLFPITISCGVAATAGDQELDAQKLIQEADANLYHAKRGGRNRVAG